MLNESKTSAVMISTQATNYGSAADDMVRRCWNDDPKQGRVIRSVQLDGFGRLVTQPITSTETVIEVYKKDLLRRIQNNEPQIIGERLGDGYIWIPWYEIADPDTVAKREAAAAVAAVKAIQHGKLERWYTEANQPPHQDPHSLDVVRNVMPKDVFEMEMMSKDTRDKSGDPSNYMSKVFDRYSMNLWKRNAELDATLATNVNLPEGHLPPKTRDYREKVILEHYFGPGTVWKHSKLGNGNPVVFVGLDPSGGSAVSSMSVVISAIFRESVLSAELQQIAATRSWDNAQQAHRYFESTDTLILGAECLPPRAADPKLAVQFVLQHIVGLISTYDELFSEGVTFVLVPEVNMWGFGNEFCQFFTMAANAHVRPMYENVRLNRLKRHGGRCGLKPDLLEHIIFYHDIERAKTKWEETASSLGRPSCKGVMDAGSWKSFAEYVLPRHGLAHTDSVGVMGTITTSVLKNRGFCRFAASVLRESINFHPSMVTNVSTDMQGTTPVTRATIRNTMLAQIEECPKRPHVRDLEKIRGGLPQVDPQHRPGQVLFCFGKGAKPGYVDDFPTLMAILFDVSHSIALLAALSTVDDGTGTGAAGLMRPSHAQPYWTGGGS